MTSDSSDPARRKHHHSSHSDVETDEPSKRRKHGHHHHHRRRHHRHHGKKPEEIDSKLETEVKEAEVEIEGGKEVLGSGAVGVAMSSSNLGIDYDMEEGEIIEDDAPPNSAAYDVAEDTENKKLSSDMDHHEAHAEGPNFGMPIEKKVEEVDRSKNREGLSWEGISSEKYLANGNLVGERHKHEGKCSPIEESRTQKHYYGDGNDLKDWKRSLTPDNAGKRRKTAKVALPRDGYEDEGPYGKDSKSPDRSRGLPQSQSTSEEVSISEVFHKPEDVFYKDRKSKGDKDYERVTGLVRDYCHGSQDFLKEKERERSSSRSRYSSQDDRLHSHETAERYREGSREIDRDRTKNRDRERGRTRGKEGDRVTERNRERERVRQKEMERGRARERERVREKEIEEDRARERERVREKEIERDRARERERDNYRGRQWDNDRKRERERESRWESDRESSRGRSRDKERDKETDRYRRANKYDDLGSSYGDRDKFSVSRRIKDDGTGHREKKNDPVIKSSDHKLHEIETDISKRDEDEQDYQEEISFQLAEHEEEEELDRIKEESRKRKQAILEKYKNLQLHPKTQLEDTAKEVIEHSSELEVGGNHMPEAVYYRADGGESHSGDKVISVGKSSNQDGFATNDQNSGAGGLGQGTPKSERSNDMFCDDIFGESPAAVHKTEERKTLDRELARAKVTANRVATVVANEWKDSSDKVMPVKQWLEERRFLQGEMQQLRDKLAISERTAKSEAQLKEKYQLRLRVLEDTLRSSSTSVRSTPDARSSSNGASRRQSLGGAENISRLASNGFLPKRSPSFQMRSSGISSVLKHAKGTSKSFDGGSRSLDRSKNLLSGTGPNFKLTQSCDGAKDSGAENKWKENQDEKPNDLQVTETEDTVPGVLHDLLQKEVVSLRKACHEKDQSLKDKDDAIEMLAKKVETLTKAMEVEAKKMRREVAAMEKEVAAIRVEREQENRANRLGNSRGSVNSSQMIPGRSVVARSRVTRPTQ